MGAVCGGGDGPAVPIDGAVAEVGDLRREGGVDMEVGVRGEAKT